MERKRCGWKPGAWGAVLVLVSQAGCQAPKPVEGPQPAPLGKQQALSAPTSVAGPAGARKPGLPSQAWGYVLRSVERYGTQPNAKGQMVQTFLVRMQYPAFLDPRLAPLNQVIRSFVEQTRDEFVQTASHLDETVLATRPLPWTLELKFSLPHSAERLVSLLFEVHTYLGGAHPITDFYTVNYDVRAQQELTITDLLASTEALTMLSQLVMQELNRQREASMDATWILRGAGPKAENYANFTLAKDRLVIHFPPDQVGPYASGSKSVSLRLGDIQALLSPRGLSLLN